MVTVRDDMDKVEELSPRIRISDYVQAQPSQGARSMHGLLNTV